MALNVFHGTTSAAIISYFPNETAAAEFLKLVNIWWTISNSKSKFNTNNRIGNAAIPDDRKAQFFRAFAAWVKEWRQLQISGCNKFTLTAQTSNALITTLEGTACLLEDLFSEGYQYVLTSRFQTDPLEKHLGKYRQMSGGIYITRLLNIPNMIFHEICCFLYYEIMAYYNKVDCDSCLDIIQSNKVTSDYVKILSRGGLTEPCEALADYICSVSAIFQKRLFL